MRAQPYFVPLMYLHWGCMNTVKTHRQPHWGLNTLWVTFSVCLTRTSQIKARRTACCLWEQHKNVVYYLNCQNKSVWLEKASAQCPNMAVSATTHGENMSTFRANSSRSTYQVKLRLPPAVMWPEQINPTRRGGCEGCRGRWGFQRGEILEGILISSGPNTHFLVLAGMWAWFRNCRCAGLQPNCSFVCDSLWVRQVVSFSWVTHPVT